jgi:hypothetical protein
VRSRGSYCFHSYQRTYYLGYSPIFFMDKVRDGLSAVLASSGCALTFPPVSMAPALAFRKNSRKTT